MGAEPSAQTLAEVLGKTLEDAAFVFAEAAESAPPFAEDVVEARLGYSGPAEGEIRLAAGVAFADTLAANLLGADPGDPEAVDRGKEAIGELLNMICGILVVRSFGSETECRLGVPSVRVVAASEYEATLPGAGSRVTMLEEEGHRIDAASFPALAAR